MVIGSLDHSSGAITTLPSNTARAPIGSRIDSKIVSIPLAAPESLVEAAAVVVSNNSVEAAIGVVEVVAEEVAVVAATEVSMTMLGRATVVEECNISTGLHRNRTQHTGPI
jgi:hypothetical protein